MTLQGVADRQSAAIADPHAPLGKGEELAVPPAPGPDPRFAPNSWSLDGKRLAGQNGFTTPGISVYTLESGSFERLADFGEWPVWLPDNRHVLFVARGREFHLLDTRTGATRLVYSAHRDTLGPPRLSRDGRVAFFSRRVTEADVWLASLQ